MPLHDLKTHEHRRIKDNKLARAAVLGVGLAAAIAATTLGAGFAGTNGASGTRTLAGDPSFTAIECGTYSGKGCAPASQRVDLTRPTFTNPTNVTNPLFPIRVELRCVAGTG